MRHLLFPPIATRTYRIYYRINSFFYSLLSFYARMPTPSILDFSYFKRNGSLYEVPFPCVYGTRYVEYFRKVLSFGISIEPHSWGSCYFSRILLSPFI